MKLIHDCVRDVLLDAEKHLSLDNAISSINIQNRLSKYSHDDILYTCQKLNEAGYIKASFYVDGYASIDNITYNGHLFLDNIRDNKIWKSTKSKVSKIASVSLPIIQEVATSIIATKLGI